jgi:methyltransferase (TIGR00027 family)
VAIRARLADDLTKEMAARGLEQLVLLGAGFDSMSLRIKDALAGVTVFEVDHPATQAVKRKVMARLGTPASVRFVAVDFEKDDFVDKLKESGFDTARRSMVIWMGVSYYLTSQAMERALAQIGSLGGPGLRLAFDYFLKEVIDKRTRNLEALLAARQVAEVGEPWIFGLEPEEVGDYVEGFGFKLIKDYDSKELRRLYCPRALKPLDYARIVVCERAATP